MAARSGSQRRPDAPPASSAGRRAIRLGLLVLALVPDVLAQTLGEADRALLRAADLLAEHGHEALARKLTGRGQRRGSPGGPSSVGGKRAADRAPSRARAARPHGRSGARGDHAATAPAARRSAAPCSLRPACDCAGGGLARERGGDLDRGSAERTPLVPGPLPRGRGLRVGRWARGCGDARSRRRAPTAGPAGGGKERRDPAEPARERGRRCRSFAGACRAERADAGRGRDGPPGGSRSLARAEGTAGAQEPRAAPRSHLRTSGGPGSERGVGPREPRGPADPERGLL
jgi:hypothetical protein